MSQPYNKLDYAGPPLLFVVLPPFSILRDHWGFFIKRKSCFGCRQSYIPSDEASRLCELTVFCYRWCVVCLFSEGFRVQDIATILHVGCTFLKKLIKLYRETSTVNYPAERAAA